MGKAIPWNDLGHYRSALQVLAVFLFHINFVTDLSSPQKKAGVEQPGYTKTDMRILGKVFIFIVLILPAKDQKESLIIFTCLRIGQKTREPWGNHHFSLFSGH